MSAVWHTWISAIATSPTPREFTDGQKVRLVASGRLGVITQGDWLTNNKRWVYHVRLDGSLYDVQWNADELEAIPRKARLELYDDKRAKKTYYRLVPADGGKS